MSVRRKIGVAGRTDIFLVGQFLSELECKSFIEMSEGKGFEEAAISTANGQVVAKDVRNNDRLIWDDPALAADWWGRVEPFVPRSFGRWCAYGVNERFRFYRYRPGQKFSRHRDGAFERSSDEMSWLTLMVYLNAGYDGGRTKFWFAGTNAETVIEPEAGAAVVFMHDRLHEGAEISSGVKYVLRTDVMYRRV